MAFYVMVLGLFNLLDAMCKFRLLQINVACDRHRVKRNIVARQARCT